MTEEFDCTICGKHVKRTYPSDEQRAKYLAAFGEPHMVTCGVCWDAANPSDMWMGGPVR